MTCAIIRRKRLARVALCAAMLAAYLVLDRRVVASDLARDEYGGGEFHG